MSDTKPSKRTPLQIGDRVRLLSSESYNLPERMGTVIYTGGMWGAGIEIKLDDGSREWAQNEDSLPTDYEVLSEMRILDE